LRCCLSPPDSSLGWNVFVRGSGAAHGLADRCADFGCLEGGRDATSRLSHCAWPYSGSSEGIKLRKGGLDGCSLPISFPVTVGLGENMAGALNALLPVPATGGGRRPCARGLSIRTSHFRIRWSLSSRASVDSHDPFFVFEAMVGVVLWYSRVRAGRRVRGPDLCMGPLVMSIGWGTPY